MLLLAGLTKPHPPGNRAGPPATDKPARLTNSSAAGLCLSALLATAIAAAHRAQVTGAKPYLLPMMNSITEQVTSNFNRNVMPQISQMMVTGVTVVPAVKA